MRNRPRVDTLSSFQENNSFRIHFSFSVLRSSTRLYMRSFGSAGLSR